uniref:11-beta-hydroxysteroid dehydrogenase type 2 n=1 Tax=Xiphophorus maculatus TaxID=8083 RepID=A0A3B5PSB2_XIPMA
MKKILASHLSAGPTLVAWLGATVLVERLWAFCLPAVLLLVLLAVVCCVRSGSGTGPPPGPPAEGKAVFITGCDTGFGNAAAKHLDSLGLDVFATVLDLTGDGARALRRSCSSRLTLLQVDITQPQQVQQALLDTKAKLGLRGLWGLVNNAGVCVNLGDAELSLMSNFRGCMEVNFFGTVSVTKSFLPLLRQAKGRIVNISSPAGDQPFPCLAAYGASKAALNLFTETLRHELVPWGVKVSTILPSSYKTGKPRPQTSTWPHLQGAASKAAPPAAPSSNNAYWEQQHQQLLQSLPPALMEEYGEDYIAETKDLFQSFAEHANPDLSPVVNAIVHALLSPQPQLRYFAGPGIGLMYFIHSYCPLSISNRFLQKLFVKKTLMPRALRKQSGLEKNNTKNNNKII